MNPHPSAPPGLASAVASLWSNRRLLADLTWREIVGRYRGSMARASAGRSLQPLLMLAVYTFVFSVVFGAQWSARRCPAASSTSR